MTGDISKSKEHINNVKNYISLHSRDIIYTSFKRDGRILTLQIILLGFKVYTSFIRDIVKYFT